MSDQFDYDSADKKISLCTIEGPPARLLVQVHTTDGPVAVTSSYPNFVPLFQDITNLAANGSVVSGILDLQALGVKDLHIRRKSAGGNYQFEIEWSRNADMSNPLTEVVARTDGTSGTKTAAARYCRIRVRNVDPVTAFSSHLTAVEGR